MDRYNQDSWFLDSCFLGVLVLLASSIFFWFLELDFAVLWCVGFDRCGVFVLVRLFLSNQYMSELISEHQKLGPFTQVLPICTRLLNQGNIFSY